MVSIPHYEDLSAAEIYQSLDLRWWASEKLDGSYLKFGLDDQGRFFCERKAGKPIYNVEDWPSECWATSYRLGHTVANMVVEALLKENAISPGQSIGAEILHTSLPNTIPYALPEGSNGMVIITSVDYEPPIAFYRILKEFRAIWWPNVMFSVDGLTDRTALTREQWLVKVNDQIPQPLTWARLSPSAKKFRSVLDHWFPRESKVSGFTVAEILDINLSKKHPNTGDRNWTALKKELKKERDDLRGVLYDLTYMFKDSVHRVLVNETASTVGAGSFKEGVVVVTEWGKFKIIDRAIFSQANHFTHIVKYWLVGGRRPNRPSFLSRTAHWPKEKRLARLEVLRLRYMDKHHTLHYRLDVGGKKHLMTYSGPLHRRTLNCFSDTRKRIENGR